MGLNQVVMKTSTRLSHGQIYHTEEGENVGGAASASDIQIIKIVTLRFWDNQNHVSSLTVLEEEVEFRFLNYKASALAIGIASTMT